MDSQSPDCECHDTENVPLHKSSTLLKNLLNMFEGNMLTSDDLSIILERLKDKSNEKIWSKEYTDIISCICERSQCYRYMHEKSADLFKDFSHRLTYYNMGLSFVLSSFTIAVTQIETLMDSSLVALISGIGHLMIAGLTGIQKRMKLPEKSESHRKSFSEFDSFCRELEYQLRLPVEDRQYVPKYVFTTIEKYETIISTSPVIPSKILHNFRHWASYNLEIDQPSIVKTFTNVHDINNYDTYYEENKTYKISKYMKEFLDVKHLHVDSTTDTSSDSSQMSDKHKSKKKDTPVMKRKIIPRVPSRDADGIYKSQQSPREIHSDTSDVIGV